MSDDALKRVAQGTGWVTIPEGIQKTHRCGAEGHGVVVDLALLR